MQKVEQPIIRYGDLRPGDVILHKDDDGILYNAIIVAATESLVTLLASASTWNNDLKIKNVAIGTNQMSKMWFRSPWIVLRNGQKIN